MVDWNGSRTRLSPKRVEEILHGLETIAAAEEDDLDVEEEKRLGIYNSARELILRVESHHASLQRIDEAPTQLAVVRLAYDIDLFPQITRRGEASVSELASATGVEPALLSRIFRHCAAHRMIAEAGPDRYKATMLTKNFTAPGFQGAIIHHHATLMRAAHAMPDFLAKIGYVGPKDRKNIAFDHALGSTGGLFDYFARDPFVGDSFKIQMASVQISEVELESNYDFERIWSCNTAEDTVLFVDVGGGVGHQCKALRDAIHAKGRFIRQFSVLKLISLTDSPTKWPVMVTEPMKKWTSENGRFLVIGDAAHAMVPWMAQGAAMPIEDAAALEELLRVIPSKNALPKAMKVFQSVRVPRIQKMQQSSLLSGYFLHIPDGPEQKARDEASKNELEGKPFITSSNQWSDPSTQR